MKQQQQQQLRSLICGCFDALRTLYARANAYDAQVIKWPNGWGCAHHTEKFIRDRRGTDCTTCQARAVIAINRTRRVHTHKTRNALLHSSNSSSSHSASINIYPPLITNQNSNTIAHCGIVFVRMNFLRCVLARARRRHTFYLLCRCVRESEPSLCLCSIPRVASFVSSRQSCLFS